MRFRFTIRDLLWLTALLAMGIGWWVDHREQADRYRQLATMSNVPATLVDVELAKDNDIARFRREIAILKSKVIYPDSTVQISAARIQELIRSTENRLKMREDELRPLLTRRLLREFEIWLESRSATQ